MALKKDEIQGLAFSGYADWPATRLRLLRITEAGAARTWLSSELQRITWGSEDRAQARAASHCRNLAFSYEGLRTLGLPAAALCGFETAFREGMAEPRRSQLLGDVPGGRSDPARWRWGGPRTPAVHLLQLLYARDESAADILCEAEAKATGAFLDEVVPAKAAHLSPDGKEHFGFADGLSQPAYHEVNAPRGAGYDARRLATGELLLGHPDSLGNLSLGPVVDPAAKGADHLPPTADGLGDFALNGAYLVARQMRQDVAGFRRMLTTLAASPAVTTLLPGHTQAEREAFAASRIVGRWPSGCPVVQSPDRDDPQFSGRNAFFFESTDPRGRLCPFGAHIRRANPRDSLFEPWRETNGREAARTLADNDRRRILRRGRAFGPRYAAETAEAERGLLFLALGASIERQFEFVQHSWVLNPNFAGLADETDPLVGGPDTDFTLQSAPVAHRLSGVAAQVWTEAGGYFFLPSRSALKFLAAQ
jgi:Dyp-type peroxidase family